MVDEKHSSIRSATAVRSRSTFNGRMFGWSFVLTGMVIELININYTLHGHKLCFFTLWEAPFPGTPFGPRARDLPSKSGETAVRAPRKSCGAGDRCVTGA